MKMSFPQSVSGNPDIKNRMDAGLSLSPQVVSGETSGMTDIASCPEVPLA